MEFCIGEEEAGRNILFFALIIYNAGCLENERGRQRMEDKGKAGRLPPHGAWLISGTHCHKVELGTGLKWL